MRGHYDEEVSRLKSHFKDVREVRRRRSDFIVSENIGRAKDKIMEVSEEGVRHSYLTSDSISI